MIEVQPQVQLATIDTHLTIQEIEQDLNLQGYTLHYLPIENEQDIFLKLFQDQTENLFAGHYEYLSQICVSLHLAKAQESYWTPSEWNWGGAWPMWTALPHLLSQSHSGVPIQARVRIFPQPEAKIMSLLSFEHEELLENYCADLEAAGIVPPLMTCVQAATKEKMPLLSSSSDFLLFLLLWGEQVVVQEQKKFLRTLAQQWKAGWRDVTAKTQQQRLLSILQQQAKAKRTYSPQSLVSLDNREDA